MPLSYTHHVQVPPSAIDVNGHVNNVEFIRWMQDAAVAHADAVGCSELSRVCNAIWVVRRHEIEYRRQAFVGDNLEVRTWIADCRHVSSRRQYEFFRPSDNVLLAKGMTDWVLLDAATFAPKPIPKEMQELFQPTTGAPAAS